MLEATIVDMWIGSSDRVDTELFFLFSIVNFSYSEKFIKEQNEESMYQAHSPRFLESVVMIQLCSYSRFFFTNG